MYSNKIKIKGHNNVGQSIVRHVPLKDINGDLYGYARKS